MINEKYKRSAAESGINANAENIKKANTTQQCLIVNANFSTKF